MPPNRDINTTLKFILDKNSLQQVQAGTMSVEDALSNVQQRLIQNKKHLVDIAENTKKWEVQARRNLVTSTAFVTGLFLYSQRYINNLDQSNSLSKRWEASSKSIEKSQERIGKVVTEAVLPAFEYGARITEKISRFVEANPEVVKTALNVGLLVLGFNALSIIAAKGIRLAADVSYIATTATQLLAARTMESAARKQLLASAGMARPINVANGLRQASAVAGTTSVAATVATTLAVIAGGTVIGTIIYDIIAKQFGLTRVNQIATGGAYLVGKQIGKAGEATGLLTPEENERKAIVFAAIIGKITNAIDESSPLWQRAVNSIKKASEELEKIAVAVRGHEYESQIVNAYAKMKEEELQATREYEAKKLEIIKQFNASAVAAMQRNISSINNILSNYDIALKSATDNYLKTSKQAETEYANERAETIKNSNEEIHRIEQNLQDRLLKLRKDHEDRVGDLVAKRDALGLKKEIQRYNRERDEEIANTNKEVAQRRRDLAIKLQDIKANYEQERAMRYAEYIEQTNQAKIQRDEQLKQQAEHFFQEMWQLRQAKQQQLNELKNGYIEEQRRRRESFIAMVRDLDASLIGEQRKKQQYYQLMLADAERFLQDYRRRMPSGMGTANSGYMPLRDSGGYMYRGLYRVAQNGVPEYAMAGSLTKLAESLVGGRLTQENLAGLMMRGNMKQLVVNENNRYDSRLSKADIRMIEEMQNRKIERLLLR